MITRPKVVATAILLFALAAPMAEEGHAQIVQAQMNQVGPTPTFPAGVAVRFASDVVALGDLDGDGLNDYAVADAGYHGSQTNPNLLNLGAVHVFSGSGNPAPRLRSFFGSARVDYFGSALTTIDDLTGDGIAELVVGAHQVGQPTQPGYVRVIDPATGAILTNIPGPTLGGWFGHGLAAINDLDGDGFRDILVLGASTAQIRSSVTGAAITASVGTVNSFSTVFTHPAAVDVIDLNLDGIDDFVIGSPNTDSVVGIDGAAFGAVLFTQGGTIGTQYGFSVSTRCDLDGDGFLDIAIGAPGADQAEARKGSTTPTLIQPPFTGTPGTNYGTAVAGLDRSPLGLLSPLMIGGTGGASGRVDVFDVSLPLLQYTLNPAAPTVGYGSRVADGGIGTNGWNSMAVATGQGFAAGPGGVTVYFGAPMATAVSRGTGCGPLGPSTLLPVGSPTLGNLGFSFFYISPFGGSTLGLAGAFFVGAPSPPILVFPGCFTYFTGGASVGFTPTASGFLPLAIPANPGLAGSVFTGQIATTDGVQVEFSNAVDITLGY